MKLKVKRLGLGRYFKGSKMKYQLTEVKSGREVTFTNAHDFACYLMDLQFSGIEYVLTYIGD